MASCTWGWRMTLRSSALRITSGTHMQTPAAGCARRSACGRLRRKRCAAAAGAPRRRAGRGPGDRRTSRRRRPAPDGARSRRRRGPGRRRAATPRAGRRRWRRSRRCRVPEDAGKILDTRPLEGEAGEFGPQPAPESLVELDPDIALPGREPLGDHPREGTGAGTELDDRPHAPEIHRCQHRLGQRSRTRERRADRARRAPELLEEKPGTLLRHENPVPIRHRDTKPRVWRPRKTELHRGAARHRLLMRMNRDSCRDVVA